MSLAGRSLLRQTSALRVSRATPPLLRGLPALSSIGARQASTSTSTTSTSSENNYDSDESFSTPFWRNTILLTLGGVVIYRFSVMHAQPHASRASSSGRPSPGNESEDDHRDEIQGENRPFLTKYIEMWLTPTSVWKERNLHHLDLAREKAEEKLFFQDAERPPVHRLRFVQVLDLASPHGQVAGGSVDMSGVVPKRASD